MVRSIKKFREEGLDDIVAKFGPLSSVRVECITNASPDSYVWGASAVHTSLRVSLHTLHTLILCVPLELISVFLPPPTLTFPNLQTLAIKLLTFAVIAVVGEPHCMNPLVLNPIETYIKPFIARHSRSLCSLDFAPPTGELLRNLVRPPLRIMSCAIDIAHVLRSIPRIDRLTSISFTILNNTPADALPDIAKFLTVHAGTLRTLNICFSMSYWTPAELAVIASFLDSLRFPQLEDLFIGCGNYPWPPNAVLERATQACIRDHPTLKSLRILGGTQSPLAIDQLFDPVVGCFGKGVLGLYSLQLRLQELTPSVLGMFANNLPNLHELHLLPLRYRRRTGSTGAHADRVFGEEYEVRHFHVSAYD